MIRKLSTRSRRIGATITALGAVSLALGACSSTSNALSSVASSVASSANSGSSGSSASNFLQQLQQKASSATHATFKASYTSTQGSGSTQTLTFAQKGSKSSFTSGTTTFYSDGTTSTFCDNSQSPPTCTQTSGTGANPLAGLLTLFSPQGVSSAIQAAAAAAAGVTVSHSSETHGGQASSCISYSRAGQGVKYCVNGDGVVTLIQTPTGSFELTSYTTSVSDSDVSVPAGVTIVTEPSIP